MNMKKQSVTSFVRKQLNVRGKTCHSGRGFYMCDTEEATSAEIFHTITDGGLLSRWRARGIVQTSHIQKDKLTVVFNFDCSYKVLVVCNDDNKNGYIVHI